MSPRTAVSAESTDREADFVQSLQRGLAVIRAFDGESRTLTLGEVATATGLARAAARRFLLTLVDLGYVRVDARLFELSPRVLELGRAYLSSLRLPTLAHPHLEALVDDVGESATIAVLDATDIVYVAHVPARRIMSITIGVGTRDPAFATSLGRVLLAAQDDAWLDGYLGSAPLSPITDHTVSGARPLRAELARVRRQGYALVDQELEDGLRAVAVPIHDAHGAVVAAVNLAVHAGRWTVEAIRADLLPRLREAANAIEAALATAEPPLPAAEPREAPNGNVARDADFVQSLERGLLVIRAFDGAPTALTLSDVAKTTGLPRAAARRFLLTLVELGYMEVDGRRFSLRPRVLDLGRPYLSRLTLPDLALPHMRTFVNDVRESSTVAVLDGSRDRLRRARIGSPDPLRLRRRRDARSCVRHCPWPGAPGGPGRGMARRTRALVPAAALHRADDHQARGLPGGARAHSCARLRAGRPGARGRAAGPRGPDPRRAATG